MKLSSTACDGLFSIYKAQILGQLSGESVLDVGCNTGQLVDYCIKAGKSAIGVEYDFNLLIQSYGQSSKRLLQSNAQALPFASNSFDTVVLWNVLEHVDNDQIALSEALRVCRLNIIIVVPKEDDLSTSLSSITYRHYVDLGHRRYYTREKLQALYETFGAHLTHYEETSRVRPLMAYVEIGIPKVICSLLDRIFWRMSSWQAPDTRSSFLSALVTVVEKGNHS
jgi:ubiquinone/menaquinone biosynthesis C-methylase UbiE